MLMRNSYTIITVAQDCSNDTDQKREKLTECKNSTQKFTKTCVQSHIKSWLWSLETVKQVVNPQANSCIITLLSFGILFLATRQLKVKFCSLLLALFLCCCSNSCPFLALNTCTRLRAGHKQSDTDCLDKRVSA